MKNNNALDFQGFSTPNGTVVPDELFDVVMPALNEAELKVLLYIVRRTFGFKKSTDDISLRQMVEGITKRDGTILDRGTGLSKATVARGLAGLRDKGIILAVRNRSDSRGDEPTTYRLKFRDAREEASLEEPATPVSDPRHPLSQERDTPPVSGLRRAVSQDRDPQQTGIQTTGKQQTDLQSSNFEAASVLEKNRDEVNPPPNGRSGRGGDIASIGSILAGTKPQLTSNGDSKAAIAGYIRDISRELGDRAPIQSSITRAVRLFQGRDIALPLYIDALFRARAMVREQRQEVGSQPVRNGMAYFFGCLEQELGEAHVAPSRTGTGG